MLSNIIKGFFHCARLTWEWIVYLQPHFVHLLLILNIMSWPPSDMKCNDKRLNWPLHLNYIIIRKVLAPPLLILILCSRSSSCLAFCTFFTGFWGVGVVMLGRLKEKCTLLSFALLLYNFLKWEIGVKVEWYLVWRVESWI